MSNRKKDKNTKYTTVIPMEAGFLNGCDTIFIISLINKTGLNIASQLFHLRYLPTYIPKLQRNNENIIRILLFNLFNFSVK